MDIHEIRSQLKTNSIYEIPLRVAYYARVSSEKDEDGVAVLFQNDNINTLDEDSELRLTIMSGIAQDEVRKLSSRIKFGHSQAIKNGVVMG